MVYIKIVIILIFFLSLLNIKIPVTQRNHKIYLKFLYPDFKNINYNSKLFNNKFILDVGCGNNIIFEDSLLFKLNENNNNSIVIGIDPSVEKKYLLENIFNLMNKKKFNYKYSQNYFLQNYGDNISINNNKVDIILSFWLLGSWINNEEELLEHFKEFYRLLKKNGQIRIYPIFSLNNIKNNNLKSFLKSRFYCKQIYTKPTFSESIKYFLIPSYTWILIKK